MTTPEYYIFELRTRGKKTCITLDNVDLFWETLDGWAGLFLIWLRMNAAIARNLGCSASASCRSRTCSPPPRSSWRSHQRRPGKANENLKNGCRTPETHRQPIGVSKGKKRERKVLWPRISDTFESAAYPHAVARLCCCHRKKKLVRSIFGPRCCPLVYT